MFGFFGNRGKDTPPKDESPSSAPNSAPQSGGMVQEQTPQYGNAAPGTQIRYDWKLVDKFKGEHGELLRIYGAIGTAFDAGQYDQVQMQLTGFSDALRAHLLDENLRFYTYLQHVLTNDEDNAEIMRDFRREMAQIGKDVYGFIKRYTDTPLRGELVNSFKQEFDAIGPVLVRRIEAEEKHLYPLYMPPEAYGH